MVNLFKYDFFFLNQERQREWKRQKKKALTCWKTPQMLVTAGPVPGRSEEPGAPSKVPCGWHVDPCFLPRSSPVGSQRQELELVVGRKRSEVGCRHWTAGPKPAPERNISSPPPPPFCVRNIMHICKIFILESDWLVEPYMEELQVSSPFKKLLDDSKCALSYWVNRKGAEDSQKKTGGGNEGEKYSCGRNTGRTEGSRRTDALVPRIWQASTAASRRVESGEHCWVWKMKPSLPGCGVRISQWWRTESPRKASALSLFDVLAVFFFFN